MRRLKHPRISADALPTARAPFDTSTPLASPALRPPTLSRSSARPPPSSSAVPAPQLLMHKKSALRLPEASPARHPPLPVSPTSQTASLPGSERRSLGEHLSDRPRRRPPRSESQRDPSTSPLLELPLDDLPPSLPHAEATKRPSRRALPLPPPAPSALSSPFPPSPPPW